MKGIHLSFQQLQAKGQAKVTRKKCLKDRLLLIKCSSDHNKWKYVDIKSVEDVEEPVIVKL